MNFKEWLKANDVSCKFDLKQMDTSYKNIENVLGKQFWICDYRLNWAKDSKPIRNVTPKLVQVVSNDELPKNKHVYHSPIHFKEVNNWKVISTVISPYDNTGYRAYPGIPVNIFNDREECIEFFKEQCNTAIKEYEEELERRTREIHSRIAEIEGMKDSLSDR